MKVIELQENPHIYTCRSYLVLGGWNRIEDINTLIDPGTDGSVVSQIETTHTGVGKKAVQQVVLTHNHFDHAGGLKAVKERFTPVAMAMARGEGVDRLLRDGEILHLGDRDFVVIATPGHSNDSLCLYCSDGGVLFSGDTPLRFLSAERTYSAQFVDSLRRLSELPIQIVYPGHGVTMRGDMQAMIRESLGRISDPVLSQNQNVF